MTSAIVKKKAKRRGGCPYCPNFVDKQESKYQYAIRSF